MRRFLGRVIRWGIIPLLLFLGLSTGGADGVVGWFALAWMLFRGGPGMWADVLRFMSWGRSRRFSFRGIRRASGGELNA